MSMKQQQIRGIGSSRISILNDTTNQSPLHQSPLFQPINHHITFDSLLHYFQQYQPRSPLINLQKLNQSNNLKLKKYKQAAYYGEIVNGKRHGLGIMLYNNHIYQGQWESDFKHGKGYQQFSNQCLYTGCYVNGNPEGLGRFQWPNGQFYEGEWLSGYRHGSGMWNGAKGDSYIGQWKFGKADGFGVHIWVNGDRYQGYFKKSLKHGQGTQKFVSGDIYKGTFYEGKPNGYGQYVWADGSFYKGLFKNGFRQGNGVWKKSSGNSDKYEGDYVRDKKQGYGIFSWASGNIYKGHYFQDLRDGYGQMFWNDGNYYKGQWRKGYQQGQGAFYTEESGLQKGRFQQNQLFQLYDSLQELQNMPTKKRKKKNTNQTDRIAFSVKLKDKSHSLVRQKEQAKLIAKIADSSYRSKFPYNIETVSFIKNKSNNQISIFTSRFDRKRPLYLQDKKLWSIKQDKKQYTPHSTFTLKNIQQRMRTGRNQLKIKRTNRYKANSQLKTIDHPKLQQQYNLKQKQKHKIRNSSTIL